MPQRRTGWLGVDFSHVAKVSDAPDELANLSVRVISRPAAILLPFRTIALAVLRK